MNAVLVVLLLGLVLSTGSVADDEQKVVKPKKKKSVMDMNDEDLKRIYQQWEEADEDKLEDDELPSHMRTTTPSPELDVEALLKLGDHDKIMQTAKKGQTVMMFVTVSGDPTKRETEDITQLWQGSLFNAHIDVQRFSVEGNRVIFLFQDGSKAWEAKDYLIQQERCAEVTLEGKSYPGKGAPQLQSEPKRTEL